MDKAADISRWIKRAKKLMAQCPKGYWLFAANGNLHVMRGDRERLPGGGMDPSLSVGEIAGRGMLGPAIDGGDW